jgi:hypothetical protein
VGWLMTHRERGIVNKSRTNERRGEKDPNMPVRKRARNGALKKDSDRNKIQTE